MTGIPGKFHEPRVSPLGRKCGTAEKIIARRTLESYTVKNKEKKKNFELGIIYRKNI